MKDSGLAVNDPVRIVREALRGGTLIVIGGDRRVEQLARLSQAFELSDVRWIETRESDPSARRFSSALAQRGTLLVVSLQGLVRHQHARDIRDLCKLHGTPHLPLWRSPNPRAIAEAVVGGHLLEAMNARRS